MLKGGRRGFWRPAGANMARAAPLHKISSPGIKLSRLRGINCLDILLYSQLAYTNSRCKAAAPIKNRPMCLLILIF